MSGGLSRDEKKARKAIEPAFNQAFKTAAKAKGWSYLKPTAFKQIGEWFVAFDPVVWTDERLAELWANIKPFEIDELMSRIMGFKGLAAHPLSLRARGPHCVVRPMRTISIESGGDVDAMLRISSDFMDDTISFLSTLSLADFVEICREDLPAGQVSANFVAALVLSGRREEALEACESAISSKQWGGPARMTDDGRMYSFFEFAKRWIANEST
jgi:hypothetical protein